MADQTTDTQQSGTESIKDLPRAIRREMCLKEIRDTRRLIGPRWNKAEMARKYGFEWNTIHAWVNKILLSEPKEDISLIATKSEETVENTLNWLQRLVANPSLPLKDRMTAASMQKDYLEVQAKLLEAYGRKQKAVDRSEVKVSGITPERLLDIATKSNERRKRRESDPSMVG